jgi:hypothetical protein
VQSALDEIVGVLDAGAIYRAQSAYAPPNVAVDVIKRLIRASGL